MDRYIPYIDGDEWHYLADKYRRKYGADYTCRDLFSLSKLTPAERRLYLWVRNQTMQARLR